DHAALRHEMEAMKASEGNHQLITQHDLEFHKIIFEAAGSRVCSLLFTVVHRSLQSLIEMTSHLVSVDHTLQFHQRIYTAIAQGNSEEARKRTAEHLADVNVLLSRVNDQQQQLHLQSRISELAARPPRLRVNKS
ncbi:MAG: FadR/GntR family transcriptional regulator, partial [Vicinamibacteraceae bacterium]